MGIFFICKILAFETFVLFINVITLYILQVLFGGIRENDSLNDVIVYNTLSGKWLVIFPYECLSVYRRF